MLEKHGPLMNAGQPSWEDRTFGSSLFRDLAMTRDFLDSRSDKLQTPYPSNPFKTTGQAKIEAYWGGHQ